MRQGALFFPQNRMMVQVEDWQCEFLIPSTKSVLGNRV